MNEHQNRDFVTVQELSEGFSEFSLPQTQELTGKKIELYYEAGHKAVYYFLDETTLVCTVESEEGSEKVAAIYQAVSPRKDIYFIDFVWSYGATKSVTTILDLAQGIATTAIGILPGKEEVLVSQFERGDKGLPLTSVTVDFEHASVDVPFTPDTLKHARTADLVGKRMQWVYSANDAYEHIYLNENFYTWQCLKGIEKGLCDTDKCHYFKLDDNLYWFIWQERIVPTIGSVMEDFNAMRSYGKIYGYETYEMTKVTNFPVGSFATLLNETTYTFNK
ncbi:molybdenum cofactor biosynthesis F family protein [Paenibacillus sp. HW567]|uniref:molybdenum cofactor biosynthesis F family protein n=1 Tax=Paenibacillus sp. HW567 TaxID=1034769 RepID=UPI00037D919E|nr:molybdenum cofactor biosynthesis F family protein [Paenibacillus sp. HW567]